MAHPEYNAENDVIELVPYNPEWPSLAQKEIAILRKSLPAEHIIDIQHVGSTAISNMRAKPILDIQIAVDSLEAIKPMAISALAQLEYIFWDANPDLERMFFVKSMPPFGEKRTHHVHITEYTSKHWQDKIFFRDYLKAHPETAKEYEDLKCTLEKRYKYDREQYTDAKTSFINKVLIYRFT
ncbi:MAG: GrpB family protein [Gammaproteobacteria bacterium]